jgi:hypothetical protein
MKEHTPKIRLSIKANLLLPYISSENRNMTSDINEIMIEFKNNPISNIGEIDKTAVAA